MTQQYKFGDLARHKESGALFVVADLEPDDGHIAAMCQTDAIVWSIKADMLEPVPHPDTVRLDWFEEHSKNPLGSGIINDGGVFVLVAKGCRTGHEFPTLRDAIDFAISETAADA